MQKIFTSGKYLFAIAILAFGIIQIVTGNFMSRLLPFPGLLPARMFFVYFLSISFIVSAACIIINISAKAVSFILGLLLAFLVIYPHLAVLISNIYDPNEWTVIAEIFAVCGGAFILAGISDEDGKMNMPLKKMIQRIGKISRYSFAEAALVFGVLHFKYAAYIVTLIPAWIPFPEFWSHAIFVAFFVIALSIFLNIQTRLITALSGIMFLLWVFIIHVPRVAASTHTETEWTSLFVALAMAGISFMLTSRTYKVSKNLQS